MMPSRFKFKKRAAKNTADHLLAADFWMNLSFVLLLALAAVGLDSKLAIEVGVGSDANSEATVEPIILEIAFGETGTVLVSNAMDGTVFTDQESLTEFVKTMRSEGGFALLANARESAKNVALALVALNEAGAENVLFGTKRAGE